MSMIREPFKKKGGTHEEDLIAWALDVLIEHFAEFPNHGPGCSCSDQVSSRLRKAVRARREHSFTYQEAENVQKAYRSLSNIFYRLWQEH